MRDKRTPKDVCGEARAVLGDSATLMTCKYGSRDSALKKVDFITKHTVGFLQISIPLSVHVHKK